MTRKVIHIGLLGTIPQLEDEHKSLQASTQRVHDLTGTKINYTAIGVPISNTTSRKGSEHHS